MGTKLYVGNLPFETTEGELSSRLEQAGTVTSCTLITDNFTGQSRGFGFAEMGSQDSVNKAISVFNDQNLKDRTLTVNEARPREARGNAYAGVNRNQC